MTPNRRDAARTGQSIALIRSAQAGDQQALDQLIRRYYDRVYRIVRVRMGSFLLRLESVDDLVQETFIAAIRDFDHFQLREDAGLIQWLSRLAERRIKNAIRYHRAAKRDAAREARLQSVAFSSSGSSIGYQLARETTEIPARIERQEVEDQLEQALRELPETQREVVLLRSFGEGSWKFIAEELGLASDEAARKLFGRARVKLAQILSGHFH